MRIMVLPCDGIGPEITAAGMQVLDAAARAYKLDFKFDYEESGFDSLKKYGTTLRQETLDRAKTYDGIILGTQSHADYPPPEEGGRNVSASFRVGLDLFANVRPARTRPYLPTNMPVGRTMDLVIMREATEGFYADRNMTRGWGEVMPSPDMALSTRKITAHCSERIARASFELAMKRRKKVTAIHKLNCFLMTDGLFMREVRKVAKEFPEVEFDDLLVDASTAYLVRDPSRFDVLCATNFFGDILSDLASELSGSLGLAGSVNASKTHCCAQAQHGSAPTIAGKDIANPTSMILSIAMLVQWMGDHRNDANLRKAGDAMEAAVDKTLENPATRTADIGGKLGCKAFGEAVAKVLV
ncbi:MAG TPA: isocitrate/isopropylmalate dehydrogenase family protein [Burkholderiales bacterium]|nr:isocitrate/isopropylmalate dehydrogenase family protein [Burkholderiales bacterium]